MTTPDQDVRVDGLLEYIDDAGRLAKTSVMRMAATRTDEVRLASVRRDVSALLEPSMSDGRLRAVSGSARDRARRIVVRLVLENDAAAEPSTADEAFDSLPDLREDPNVSPFDHAWSQLILEHGAKPVVAVDGVTYAGTAKLTPPAVSE